MKIFVVHYVIIKKWHACCRRPHVCHLEVNIPVMWHLENFLLIFHNVCIQSLYNLLPNKLWISIITRYITQVGDGWPNRVSALDSGLAGVIVLCRWSRYFTLTVHLSTQEYKWVPANCQGNLMKCWEVTCDGLASHPGLQNTPSRLMLRKPG